MGLTSIWHWIIVLIIVVLVFGTKKLRNIGRDLGGAVHDFKEGLEKGQQEEKQESNAVTQKNAESIEQKSEQNKS